VISKFIQNIFYIYTHVCACVCKELAKEVDRMKK